MAGARWCGEVRSGRGAGMAWLAGRGSGVVWMRGRWGRALVDVGELPVELVDDMLLDGAVALLVERYLRERDVQHCVKL